MTRVESDGSMWLIDDDNARYCRLPKTEGPREQGDWPDPKGTALEDLTWHAMLDWRVSEKPVYFHNAAGELFCHEETPVLVITTSPNRYVFAPHAVTRLDRTGPDKANADIAAAVIGTKRMTL